ncbi:MAG TPA: histidine kinase [Clostridiales bacterium]|nr:histidine kinase [Clostridiales bacterium]
MESDVGVIYMPEKSSNWRKSIFTRLLSTFFIIIIPLYFMGSSVYRWGAQSVRKEISNSMVAQINSYLKGLEYEIRRIQDLQYNCLSDKDLNRIAAFPEGMSDLVRVLSVMRLQYRLYSIRKSSEYIQDVRVYIPSINKVVNESRFTNAPSNDWFNTLAAASLSDEPIKMYKDNNIVLSAAFPRQSPVTDRKPMFIIEILLSETQIRNALMRMDDYKGRGTMLISPEHNMRITYSADSDADEIIYNELMNRLQKSSSGSFTIKLNKTPHIAIYSTSDYLNVTLCKYIPESQIFAPLFKYQILFYLFTALAVAIIIGFTFYTRGFIHQPLMKLVKSFQMVEKGDLSASLEHEYDDEFSYLYKCYNEMVNRLKNLFDQVYTQKLLAQKSELKQLQSQINPHFLYNCFFSLNSMIIQREYDNAEYFTRQLGSYFQYVTRNAAEEVPLIKEIRHAKTYAEIQARRFRNRICLDFCPLPQEFHHIIVPRLIVQPIIENAFEHGLKNKISNGFLLIDYYVDADILFICIEDNGNDLREEDIAAMNAALADNGINAESTAIINIHRRLRLKYGEKSGLRFSAAEPEGLRVEIMIPLHGMEMGGI